MNPIKNILKQTNLYNRHYPHFTPPKREGQSYWRWLHNRIENMLAGKDGTDSISALNNELFSNTGYLAEIVNLAQIKDKIHPEDWSRRVNSFIKSINETQATKLNSRQWKDLCFIATRFGLHRAGYAFRQKAIDYLYEKGTRNKDISELCELCTAAMEIGDFETAKKIMKKTFRLHRLAYSHMMKTHITYSLFYDFSYYNKNINKLYRQEDILFADYVKDKRVAIVGPAKIDEKHGVEIDTFDIIVRMTYQGQENIPVETAGSKTHISYYSGEKGLTLNEIDDNSFIRDLDWVIQKTIRNKKNTEGINERSRIGFYPVFAGSFTLLWIAVLDLLMFDVKEIKIFNANFQLSETIYDKGYYAKIDLDTYHNKDKILFANTHHDTLTQIAFARNLRNVRLCQFDAILENILNMSNDDIAKKYDYLLPYIWDNHLLDKEI